MPYGGPPLAAGRSVRVAGPDLGLRRDRVGVERPGVLRGRAGRGGLGRVLDRARAGQGALHAAGPAGAPRRGGRALRPAPYLRRSFTLAGPVGVGPAARHRARPVRGAAERAAGRRRVPHPRLDRLRTAGALPGLRRDRAAPRRGERARRGPRRRLVLRLRRIRRQAGRRALRARARTARPARGRLRGRHHGAGGDRRRVAGPVRGDQARRPADGGAARPAARAGRLGRSRLRPRPVRWASVPWGRLARRAAPPARRPGARRRPRRAGPRHRGGRPGQGHPHRGGRARVRLRAEPDRVAQHQGERARGHAHPGQARRGARRRRPPVHRQPAHRAPGGRVRPGRRARGRSSRGSRCTASGTPR